MKSSPAVSPLLLAFSLHSPLPSALSQCCGGQSFSASGRTSAGRSSVITDFGPRDRAIVKFTSSAAGQITRGDNAWLVPGGPGGSSQTFYLPPPAPALTQGSSGETATTTMTGATGATSTTTTDSNEETAEAKCPEPKQPSASVSSVVHGRYEPANPPTAKGPNEKQDANRVEVAGLRLPPLPHHPACGSAPGGSNQTR